MSRARNQPDAALLARAIDHVRRAIELERNLAEAHATLSFLLVSAGRFTEALAAARRAVALEPGYWGNQFRLAHAAWGEERLRALARAMDLYPDFPFAHFEAAMVHIARGTLERAESVLREGTIVQDRQANLKQRYPAKGLHWLLGLVRLARGDAREARRGVRSRDRVGPTQLYAPEFAMNAYDGAGFVALETGIGRSGADVPQALEIVSGARPIARRPRRGTRRRRRQTRGRHSIRACDNRHRRAATGGCRMRECCVGRALVAAGGECRAEAHKRSRVLRKELERLSEHPHRIGRVPGLEDTNPAPSYAFIANSAA